MEREKDIEGITSLKTVVKGAGIFFIGAVLSRFITYFTRIFIARYFGPADYGLFSLGLAIIGFAGAFAVLGLPAGVTRYISYYRSKKEEAQVKGVLIFSLFAVALVSCIFGGALFLVSPQIAIIVFHKPELTNVFRIFAISVPFAALSSVLTSSFEGFQDIKYRVYTERIILNVLKLVSIVFFGVLGYGVLGIVWGYTLATVLTFFIALYFLESRVFSLRTKIKPIYIKREMLVFSLPLMLAGFMSTIMTRIDTVMLGYFRSAVEVGIYNAAVPTAQILNIATSSMAVLFLPVITELYARGQKEPLEVVYKTVTKWTFYLNLPVLLIMVFFSPQVMNLMFGPEYIAGYLALSILATGLFTGTLSFAPYYLLTMSKNTRTIFFISIVATLINVVLNWVLIPVYGLVGAAMATAATYLVNLVLLLAYSWHIMRISPFSTGLMKSIPAGLLSMAAVYLVGGLIFKSFGGYLLFLLFLLFMILYVVLILLFSGLQREDIEILKAIEKKTGLRSEPIRNVIKKFIK
ncbi:stage V sporulation protein B [archaeon BMS3Abin16]|nr:stage V sporulation protein B [archaeon BMS3Abin16]